MSDPYVGKLTYFRVYSGTADKGGAGMLGWKLEDRPANAPPLPLAPPGLYRVEITHPDREIPAKFNSRSTLGLETTVAARNPAGGT